MTAGPETRAERRTAHRAGRRALIDAEDFSRARAVAALQRGDSLALEEVARRPNAALGAGVVVTLLVAAGFAGTAYITGRPPAGWQRDHTLVIDETTGARFVVDDGVLHPAPTLTSAVLAGSGRTPVLVPHDALGGVPLGSQLPGADLPESPPSVPAEPGTLLACTSIGAAAGTAADAGGGGVEVWTGSPRLDTAEAAGLLVSPPNSSDLLLVTGAKAYPITQGAAEDLGYSLAQVRAVPWPWLDLLERGAKLAPLAVPAADQQAGVDGIGAAGEVVTVAGSDERLLVSGGQLHAFDNRTSALLAPPPVREVSGQALAAAQRGAPVGLLDAPSSPPAVPAREDAVAGCLPSNGGALSVVTAISERGSQASPPLAVADRTGTQVSVVWHQATGSGVLVGPPGVDDPASRSTSEADRALLVSEGIGYPLADDRTVSVLGLKREQALPLSPAWLTLAPTGPVMSAS